MSRPRSLFAEPRVLGREQAQEITRVVLGSAHGDETRVTVESIARGNTRFAINQVSTGGDNFDVVVTVRSTIGERSGSASTNDLSPASLRRVVDAAERLARLSPRDPEYVPELGAQAYGPGLGWADATAVMDPAGRAAAVAKVTTPAAAANLVSTGYMEARASSLAVANTKGLFAYGRQTESVLTTTVRTPDGRGSGWAGAASNDWSQVKPDELAARAIDKARRSMEPVAVEPGRYTTILEPTAVGNLVQLIAGAASARAADEGRSFFSKPGGGNKIGTKVVDERVSITSDPFALDGPDLPFFADGFPARRIAWIEEGVVRNLAYDRYWAMKQGREPNIGSGGGGFAGGGGGGVPGGIRMSGGSSSLDDLIRSTERGILVTRFWYIRPVDPRTILYTGLTRDGTFLIENGRVTRPVKNLRFNESPIFMLNNLEGMTPAVRVSATEGGNPGRPVIVPAIKVHDFAFTSLSDAI